MVESTSLFPFRIKHLAAESLLSTSLRLDLLRHGLDDELVMLRMDGEVFGSFLTGGIYLLHYFQRRSKINATYVRIEV